MGRHPRIFEGICLQSMLPHLRHFPFPHFMTVFFRIRMGRGPAPSFKFTHSQRLLSFLIKILLEICGYNQVPFRSPAMTRAPIGLNDDLKKYTAGHLFIMRTWAFISLLATVYAANVSMRLRDDILEPDTSY